MKFDKLPIENLVEIDVSDMKDKLLHSDSWDKIVSIRDYCDELLEHSDDEYPRPKTMNQTINYIINKLEDMRDE